MELEISKDLKVGVRVVKKSDKGNHKGKRRKGKEEKKSCVDDLITVV